MPRPADISGFTAYLLTVKGLKRKHVDTLARITCCGLRGDDPIMVADLGAHLFHEYLRERGELAPGSIAATLMCYGPVVKRKSRSKGTF
jgi:hypothetical protein